MDSSKIKLIALDMDGTLTQHRTPLGDENRAVLEKLAAKYRLVMVGAGSWQRIHNQLGAFPLDVIGNYGMEIAEYDHTAGRLRLIGQCTRVLEPQQTVRDRVNGLRRRFDLTEYAGETVEFHASGMLTFALLGTKARIEDKLAFDPDHSRRLPMLPTVREAFADYTVFIGGSSSFDIVPKPFNKLYALRTYCEKHGIATDEAVFCGDDYREGGNDQQVYESEFAFIRVDDYRRFGEYVADLL